MKKTATPRCNTTNKAPKCAVIRSAKHRRTFNEKLADETNPEAENTRLWSSSPDASDEAAAAGGGGASAAVVAASDEREPAATSRPGARDAGAAPRET
jgi:hypothetical protein